MMFYNYRYIYSLIGGYMTFGYNRMQYIHSRV